MNNNLSFKSRINIVNASEFKKSDKGVYIDFREGKSLKSVVKAPKFYTTGIRTCTGGGVVNDDGSIGFHFWHQLERKHLKSNLNKINHLMPNIKSGLLIGSKNLSKTAKESVPNFEFTKNYLMEKCSNISYFKTFTETFAEADVKYSFENDTWDICLFSNIKKGKNNKDNSKLTLQKLKSFFKEIYISPTDELYINGQKVEKTDAPEFFVNTKTF